jgi:hypothetical protein
MRDLRTPSASKRRWESLIPERVFAYTLKAAGPLEIRMTRNETVPKRETAGWSEGEGLPAIGWNVMDNLAVKMGNS